MARQVQKEAVGAVPIFLSDKTVLQSEIGDAVPRGFRPATLEEVAVNWRHNSEFREQLSGVLRAWTATKGQPDLFEHEINDGGKLIPLINNRGRFWQLPSEKRAFLYPNGSNSQRLAVANESSIDALGVSVDAPFSTRFPVAYVKTGSEVEAAAINVKRP